jgi:hypothetical protein
MPYFTYPYIGRKQQCTNVPIVFPPQHQDQRPGLEYLMNPRPLSENPYHMDAFNPNRFYGRRSYDIWYGCAIETAGAAFRVSADLCDSHPTTLRTYRGKFSL